MEESWLKLESKVAIVTGGASGIGLQVSRELLSNGVTVVVADVNGEEGARDDGSYFIKCDVTDRQSVERAVATTAKRFGTIDILVNNAGVNLPRLLVDDKGERPDYELSEADFDLMVAVNQKGPYLFAQSATKVMLKQRKGVIINITSEAGQEGSAGQSCYSATKGAVMSFTRAWAKELGKFNIRVIGIAPGVLETTGLRTDAYNKALAYTRGTTVDALSTDYSKSIPLRREGKLAEIGDLVTYLASDRASYITGTTFNISGGKSRG
ncbi:SDR family oxidoreductase [Salipaludibacillus sp. LMS25]|jgi:sorbitol-6-phosphate 2-dehydrogenase|uniref:SDR family oxidoreductase n=1 Tax=Salipaludibacillus sp. LMS25 TaxID=2924031 RepID=UPI0020D0B69C|nr:SDR family oxidoreductase [Salipaludibacillus sp. LMS25]UTR13791.1 SDR family oxidoreductase [Salipaludibacillus sp. LMS25]